MQNVISSRTTLASLLLAAVAVVPVVTATAASAATATAGSTCVTAAAKSGALVCTKKSGKLVWVKAAAATATKVAAATATTQATPTTVATAAAASSTGIDGTWKPTSASAVGYRAKEVLNGQSTEGVGRTNGVTGSVTIAGTRATAATLTVDVTKLKSDQNRRDGQVQNRILDTSTFPTAVLKLTAPVDFGKVPADKEAITTKAKVDLTFHGVTKTVDVSLGARRVGATIELEGTIPVVWADYSIPDPSNGFAQVEPKGEIEFLVVLGK